MGATSYFTRGRNTIKFNETQNLIIDDYEQKVKDNNLRSTSRKNKMTYSPYLEISRAKTTSQG